MSAQLVRKIIEIDDEKCDGCGICADACHEGAIAIEDGKARLVSDEYCDGLGDCIGECPQGAITIIERNAAAYDQQAVEERAQSRALPCGCPGSAVRDLKRSTAGESVPTFDEAPPSRLPNWPVQLMLVPVNASYLQGADLLIAADCTAFAMAGFHQRLIRDRVTIVGCPKLDDAEHYRAKLEAIFTENDISSIEVAYMEVPCCGGLVRLVHDALGASGSKVPLKLTKLSVSGEIIDSVEL